MKEALLAYVKRVKDIWEHVRGNEQATKQSLIGPLFSLLGYDLTDPRECLPEYRVDFGRDRSAKPIDWAFLQSGRPIFFVEAKEAGKKLAGYAEQLGDYFAKAPEAKIGVLTNGIDWRFFTDIVHPNVMDKEPFLRWDALRDEEPPYDFLTLMQKSQFNAELIRTFAQRRRAQNLLISELNRLLEPSPEFTKLAIANIETRNLTAGVVESWKPIVANAVAEWARERTLSSVLSGEPKADVELAEDAPRVETTQDELDAWASTQDLLGSERPVGYEDTATYFKVHLPGQSFWGVCRFYFRKRSKQVWVPLPIEKVRTALPDRELAAPQNGWTSIAIRDIADIASLADVLRAAWDHQWSMRGKPVPPETTTP